MLLADHAQVADGKLYINGGGWSVTGPGPVPCAVALLFHVPWDRANTKISFELQLFTQDGQLVVNPASGGGTQLVQLAGQFEAGRPPGTAAGSELHLPLAINFPPLALTPGQRYYWQLMVDGHPEDDWRLPFTVRNAPAPKAGPATP